LIHYEEDSQLCGQVTSLDAFCRNVPKRRIHPHCQKENIRPAFVSASGQRFGLYLSSIKPLSWLQEWKSIGSTFLSLRYV